MNKIRLNLEYMKVRKLDNYKQVFSQILILNFDKVSYFFKTTNNVESKYKKINLVQCYKYVIYLGLQ